MTVKIDSLHPVMERGWRSGFGNLLWKENNLRWGGRRWIVPTLIWLAIINGFILLISLASETDPSMAAEDVPLLAMELFIGLGMFASAIGVVVGWIDHPRCGALHRIQLQRHVHRYRWHLGI